MRALALTVALLSAEAWAVYQCGDVVDSCQCGAPNPYPCCSNGGNCTWYAWEAACCNWAVGLPGWGNANQWAGNAMANGSYAALSYPVTNAVSCRTLGTYGHVAYVSSMSGGNVTVQEENCFANYGHDQATYSSSFFQAYITRAGQTDCHPGDSQNQACGNCGTQSRGCGNDGKWGGWSACGSQGECAPGDSQSEACGECGTHSRSCTGACKWDAYPTECSAGADPDAGTLECDTGNPGACADGVLRCGDGGVIGCVAVNEPTAETCDGIDNDCNGKVDDGLMCHAGELGGGAGGGGSSSPKPPVVKPQVVHGGCSTADGLSLLALCVALSVGRGRTSAKRSPGEGRN
jgi:hypothetical protein